MKNLILFFFFIFSNSFILYSQDEKKILTKKVDEIKDQIDSLEKVLAEFQREIDSINFSQGLSKLNLEEPVYLVVSSSSAQLKDKPSPRGNKIGEPLKKGESVLFMGYLDFYLGATPYILVSKSEVKGWINAGYFNADEGMEQILFAVEKISQNKREFEIEAQNAVIEAQKEAIESQNAALIEIEKEEKSDHIKRFGQRDAERISKGLYWIGMTSEMCLLSLGSPKDVNRTVGSFGVHEQWVYSDKYSNKLLIYFEDGVCTAYQN